MRLTREKANNMQRLEWVQTSTGYDLNTPRGTVGYVVMVDERPNWFGYVWAACGDYTSDPGWRFIDDNLNVDELKRSVMEQVTIERGE